MLGLEQRGQDHLVQEHRSLAPFSGGPKYGDLKETSKSLARSLAGKATQSPGTTDQILALYALLQLQEKLQGLLDREVEGLSDDEQDLAPHLLVEAGVSVIPSIPVQIKGK